MSSFLKVKPTFALAMLSPAVIGVGVTVLLTRAIADPAPQGKSAFNTQPMGKIAPWQAMRIAEKASGGRAFQAVYEFDDGQWSYGVDIVKGRKLMEIELDPTTGKVGDSEEITPDGEAKELKSDLTRALKGK